jgi:uncharacterized membrane protein/predicted DsbA family dithiol-disulfide isomerase
VVLAALSGAGVVVSVYLTYVHQRLRSEPGWESLCAISSSLNCDTVITSPFGAVGGVPLSAFAVWFYLLMGTLAAVGLARRELAFPRSPAVVLFVAGAFATALSAALAGVSTFWIGAWCPLCMALYAVNVGILVVVWRALRRTGEGLRNGLAVEWRYWRLHRRQALWGGGIALTALVSVVFASTRQTGGPGSVCAAVAGGAADIPIEMIVYSDFQCPHCRALNGALRRLRDHPRLRVVARHYPLDGACNPRARQGQHVGACLQARAAICAAAQQREAAFTDEAFEGSTRDRSGLVELAVSLGLDRGRFETCLDSVETAKRLQEDIHAAIGDEVRGTPTLFINGQRHVGVLSPEDLGCLAARLGPPKVRPSGKRPGRIGGGPVA